jgi:hypothetical protein
VLLSACAAQKRRCKQLAATRPKPISLRQKPSSNAFWASAKRLRNRRRLPHSLLPVIPYHFRAVVKHIKCHTDKT